ncbi:MAG TPA: 23S rRNA (guanosine(2251)-2'-O)-methyltransferase RlmB [Polyangiales bacterium]
MKRLLAGPRAVESAIAADPGRIVVVYVADDGKRLREFEAPARRAGVRCEARSSGELDALARGLSHQGVLAITGEYAYAELETVLAEAGPHPLIVALDQITDPHNFGAIVRSCVAFGADGIITLKDRAAPVTPVVVRASAGATERARIVRVTNLARTLELLRERGLSIVGLDAGGSSSLDALSFARDGRVLVIGSEGSGLRRLTRELCDELARIDMPGGFESLNASVAASIALYESARARAAISG